MHQHNEKHSVAVKCSNCDCVHCKECFRAHSACGDEFCESRGYYDTESCLEKNKNCSNYNCYPQGEPNADWECFKCNCNFKNVLTVIVYTVRTAFEHVHLVVMGYVSALITTI